MKISSLPVGVYRLDFVIDSEIVTDEYALLIKAEDGSTKLARMEGDGEE